MNRDEMIYIDFVKSLSNALQITEEEVDDDYRRFFLFIVEYVKNVDAYNKWLINEMMKMEICFPNHTLMIYEYGSFVKSL